MRKFLAGLAALAAVAAVPAQAATVDLRSGYTTTGTSFVYSAGGINFSVTALRYTGTPFSAAQTPGNSAPVDYAEGLGVFPSGDNRHTIDNSAGWDFLLFRFDQSVGLTGAFFANANWYNDATADTDATLIATTFGLPAGQTYSTSLGTSANLNAFFSPANKALLNLPGNVIHTDTTTSGNSDRTFNTNMTKTGTIWLLGASTLSTGNVDSFKLRNVTIQAVPEPSTWALFILGFGGVGMAMRRRQRLTYAHS